MGSAIVAVAEGITLPTTVGLTDVPVSQERRMQGISTELISQIEQIAPGEFEMRNVILGHTQRGGAPNSEDRILAKRYGVAALEACENNKFGQMVRLKQGVIDTVPIAEATGTLQRVSRATPAYQVARSIGVYLNQ